MEQNENYKFNKTIFWEEKFLTEEGGGSVSKAVKLNSPGLFEFFEQMEKNGQEILGLRFNDDKVLEVLIRKNK
tara:strand:+ start:116 stop:334 length:219 start_codon:yes stop_codon:yes gene_type:complete